MVTNFPVLPVCFMRLFCPLIHTCVCMCMFLLFITCSTWLASGHSNGKTSAVLFSTVSHRDLPSSLKKIIVIVVMIKSCHEVRERKVFIESV